MKGYFYIIIAVLMWAIGSGLLAKMIQVPGVVLVSLASLLGALALFIKLVLEKKISKIIVTDKRIFLLLIVIGVAVAFSNGLFYSAIKVTTIANAVLSHYLAPLFVAIFLAPLFLKERITGISISATFLGLLGLIFILWPGLKESRVELGILLGGGSAIFFALYMVFERKLARIAEVDSTIVAFYQLALSALIFFPFVLLHINSSGMLPSIEWIKIGIMGVVLWAFSLILLFRGLRTVPAAPASTLTYLEPIGAIFLAFLFLGEGLTLLTAFGGILILSSGIMVILKRTRS